jgi:hypothetical protein
MPPRLIDEKHLNALRMLLEWKFNRHPNILKCLLHIHTQGMLRISRHPFAFCLGMISPPLLK